MPLVTQETATLIDTLATAAAKIGSTKASAKINQLIVEILPATTEEKNDADIAEAFRLDNIALQEEVAALVANDKVKQGNLDLARDQLRELHEILKACLPDEGGLFDHDKVSESINAMVPILELAAMPINV